MFLIAGIHLFVFCQMDEQCLDLLIAFLSAKTQLVDICLTSSNGLSALIRRIGFSNLNSDQVNFGWLFAG